MKQSDNNSSDIELEREIYNNYVTINNYKDLSSFFCWLEWHEKYEIPGWLTKLSVSQEENKNNSKKSTHHSNLFMIN